MGKITFNFTNLDNGTFSSAQHLEIKHNLELAEKLPITKDIFLDIDYQKYIDGIKWEDFSELDKKAIGQLNEISYYQGVAIKLDKILDKLRYVGLSEKYKVRQLGIEMKKLFEDLTDSKYFPYINTMLHRKSLVDDIRHTLGKEVERLIDLGHKASDKKKREFLNDAVDRLEKDVMMARIFLVKFELSEDWKLK